MGRLSNKCAVRIYETGSSDYFDMPCQCGCGLSDCCQYITFGKGAGSGIVSVNFDNTIPSDFLTCLNGGTDEVYYVEVFYDVCPSSNYIGGFSDYTFGDITTPLVPPFDMLYAQFEPCVCLIFYNGSGEEMGRCSVNGEMVAANF